MSLYRHLNWLFIAPCLVACSQADGVATDGERDSVYTTRASGVATPPKEDDVCSAHRWVGLRSGQFCPAPGLSADGFWEQSTLTGPPASKLGELCAYTWKPNSPSSDYPENYTNLLPNEGGRSWKKWLARDCQVSAPLGLALPPVSAAIELNDQLLYQVDAPLDRKEHPSRAPEYVRLAVLDTAPESHGPLIPGVNGHGYALARLMDNVLCPRKPDGSSTGTCLAQPEAVLALPYSGKDIVNYKQGGHWGTPWELALAITRTVNRFVQQARPDISDAPQHLVINLSVGWEPRWGGDFTVPEKDLAGPYLAVYRALQHARCHGALVIAAAGNAPGGPIKETGAVYPARWESKHALDEAGCIDLEGPGYAASLPYPPFPDPGYRPLVHAVGGVDGADVVLRNARPESLPRLVAPGALAVGVVPKSTVVGHPGGGEYVTTEPEATRILTGSSVSAALASATAATIWAYRPRMPSSALMELLVDTGADLNQPPQAPLEASTCLGACSVTPHRLDACSAFTKACESGLERCPTVLPSCALTKPYQGHFSTISESAAHDFERAFAPLKYDGSACVDTLLTPDNEFFGTQVAPRISPQPGDHFCSACEAEIDPFAGIMHLFISIDPRTETSLEAPSLTIFAGRSVINKDLSLAVPELVNAGDSFRVYDIPIGTANVTSVRLSFAVAATDSRHTQSVSDDIPISFTRR